MSELLIRPAQNDHRVVENLLVAGAGVRPIRPAISRLVLDAPVAAKRPEFAGAAEASGTPVLIDPLTFLLQTEVSPADAWARLPFGRPQALGPVELADPVVQRDLIAAVTAFQLTHGATAVVAPYVLVDDRPEWLSIAMDLIARTREYLDAQQIRLPMVSVLALTRPRRVTPLPWRSRLERLAAAARDTEADRVALAISGTGGADDGHKSVHLVLGAVRGLAEQGMNVWAWRQGLLGLGAVAAGASGYECGIGLRERCDLVGLQAARRPGRVGPGFAPSAGVFVQPLSRSLKRRVAQELLADRQLRPRIVCDDGRCCPRGAESTLSNPRRHAVLARARALMELDRMPSRSWRLNAVARSAESGAVVADLATRVLRAADRRDRVTSTGLNALSAVADFIRLETDEVA